MKQQPEYLATSLWYKEEIHDPYQTIAEFFSAADVVSHKKTIKAAIGAALSDHICNKKNPGDLLYYFKLLESVVNAAYLLNQEKKKSPLRIGKDNAFNPNLFCGWHAGMTEWDYFPRMLSFKEYNDPYVVFKRFFKFLSLAEWKREFNDKLEYVLVTTSFWDAGIVANSLSIFIHLTKLIEAVHLIDVREINHIGGNIKNRQKDRQRP